MLVAITDIKPLILMSELEQLKNDFGEVKQKVSTILNLLQGNDSFGEHGFVKTTKETFIEHHDRLKLLEDDNIKNTQIKNMVWWLLTIVVTEGVGLVFIILKSKLL